MNMESIRREVEHFINEIGECDIDIRTELHWNAGIDGKKHLVNTEIKGYVTV